MSLKSKGKRPIYFENPEIDKLITMVIILTQEVSVLRDRLDTIERLAEAKGIIGKSEIDDYVPNETETKQRDEQRNRYIDRVLGILQTELEGM